MTKITRRGFFARLFGKEEIPPQHMFIGLQVVLMHDARPTIREELQALILEPMETSPEARRRFYKRLMGLLQGSEPFFEYGYAEIRASDHAEEDFRAWVIEIENAVSTEEEEAGDEIDGMHRLSNEKRFIVLSVAFYMDGLHRRLLDYDNENDPRRFTRHGMWELLQEINFLDYTRVLSDAVFLTPANSTDGFSYDDLHSEGWEYLVPLS